ncbi:MAG: glycosyltransferase family protein [Kordiimonas sp.]
MFHHCFMKFWVVWGYKALQCVVVIQARRQSTRLPDKVMLPLGGKPVLQWVVERCLRIKGCDKVICALPDDEYNDPLEKIALDAGADVYRGSQHDVLARYYYAVKHLDTEYVMRVTSDCPLLDPDVCAELLDKVYLSNKEYGVTSWFPHGLDCEVLSKRLLVESFEKAVHKYDREHVTLWIKRHYQERTIYLKPERNFTIKNRWVLDYPADYEFLKLCNDLLNSEENIVGWRGVVATLDSNPDAREINSKYIELWASQNRDIYKEAATQPAK